ncbi:hypothetical protein EJ08DRAFT_673823 [Tothia fuscella]|uniref:Uncharacterized protein n=1 Tax=Tothia fuscella TaxID=1048955 RepID=A0A9P4NDL4_9PEZI|nr:hypothetical protein EJ08DRAFT_673823 [Tothia fuscella]
MSITRAFTLRSRRSEKTTPLTMPLRTASMRGSDKPVDIRKISSPMALVSATNMLAYNAPDVSMLRAQRKASSSVSSGSSRSSADDSDSSAGSHLSRDTMLTDVSTPGSATNSLYYTNSKRSPRRSASSFELRHNSTSTTSSPEIPSRAPSHSKQAHERLARKRSLQQVSSAMESRSSFDFFTADLDKLHPFEKELEQLDEVAEEFGGVVRDVERESDVAVIIEKGLARFCADDYLREIRPIFARIFEPQAVAWI